MRLEHSDNLCEMGCGDPADYYWTEQIRIEGTPFDNPKFICEDCLQEKYDDFIDDVYDDCVRYNESLPSFQEYLQQEKIEEI